MVDPKQQFAELMRQQRDKLGWTQQELASKLSLTRTQVAHMEAGRRLTSSTILANVCSLLNIPESYIAPFKDPRALQRFTFEDTLSELVGIPVDLLGHDPAAINAVERHVEALFQGNSTPRQTRDRLNTILVYYGVSAISRVFFARYFEDGAFDSLVRFAAAVVNYQRDAIRLFSTLSEAFRMFNSALNIEDIVHPIAEGTHDAYRLRSEWSVIQEIPDDRLADLGYISAARIRQETAERGALVTFLEKLAEKLKSRGGHAIDEFDERTKRRMDTLLRKFHSTLDHSLFSPLFAPDPDILLREAKRLGPMDDQALERMAMTQRVALQNLSEYLGADYIDVYVATSMRTDADFISVNHFIRALFQTDTLKPLRLRYFNPTQSWIDDRIAKGLVEALMLKRCGVTIYMAQKSDTFGKDSEASVALGQGKPVLVYVPKLVLPRQLYDVESLYKRSRTDLLSLLEATDRAGVDGTVDNEAIIAKLLARCMHSMTEAEFGEVVGRHWADFDLYTEAERIEDISARATYRTWLDKLTKGVAADIEFDDIRSHVVGILVATAIRFEERARVFREIHPLALQVILSTGVLNGILVVRSVQQCADVLHRVTSNRLDFELEEDDQNYRLVERLTGSTMRVVSKHRLLRHAFEAFYSTGTSFRPPPHGGNAL